MEEWREGGREGVYEWVGRWTDKDKVMMHWDTV